jgi:protein-S-isoprenylcysteine O-methyltransferase Ste14
MLILFRATTYASLFIGFLLIYLPARMLAWAGVTPPATVGAEQIAGMVVGAAGAALALWCIFTFAWTGRGTPAPWDPPRRLVTSGPYRFVRNPMYIGAGFALGGAALYYHSWLLLAYMAFFRLAVHLFVIGYEEVALRQTFRDEYLAYCNRAGRWWPRIHLPK